MSCPICGASARIAKTTITSDIDSTDVYCNQIMVCVNPDCANHETNLENPTKVIETIRNKMN
jgi:hypothetical protein